MTSTRTSSETKIKLKSCNFGFAPKMLQSAKWRVLSSTSDFEVLSHTFDVPPPEASNSAPAETKNHKKNNFNDIKALKNGKASLGWQTRAENIFCATPTFHQTQALQTFISFKTCRGPVESSNHGSANLGISVDKKQDFVRPGVLHGAEVSFLLLNQQTWVRFSAFILMLLRFINNAV